ncbi:MAG: glycosyltransferase [Candidatus Omnitrophota bacterium]
MKIALVHDWLTGMRGGERVLEAFCELFPEAEIFTLFHFKGTVSPLIESRKIHTSFLQRFAHRKWYRYLLPLMPAAIESLNVKEFDLVISLSHCVAKGVKTAPGARHICYCFSPMRYIWDRQEDYFGKKAAGFPLSSIMTYLRNWDRSSSFRVHHFTAISQFVEKRIEGCYNRKSEVIYPFVEISRFNKEEKVGDYYLVVSAFAPYKRVDIAIEACNRLKLPLKIIGDGQEERKLRKLAGKTVEFLGWQPDGVVREYLAGCKALLFCGIEDFGIVPLEAMASGRPVIAFGAGGALETVVKGETGEFFYRQTADSLEDVLIRLERGAYKFDSSAIRQHAAKFDKSVFMGKMKDFFNRTVGSHA